jgi:hypothetical protein
MEIALLLLAALVAANVWATRRVLRADEFTHRKVLLLIGIWLMPILGALAAKDHARPRLPAGEETLPTLPPRSDGPLGREPAPRELGGGSGAGFDVWAHMAAPHGLPVLDWQALHAWVAAHEGEAGAPAAIDQGRKAWLLHLRDALGPHVVLHESGEAYILSSLEPRVLGATARYVGTTRRRVEKVLGGLARFPAHQKSILIVLDSEEDYYRYVSIYYPDGGEFSRSGGMFIHFGCPHFVAVRADLSAIEPVIAHEMTHSALAHLDLPTWLDEGVAVNTEHKLAGAGRLPHTPHEIHQMHLRFWNPATIQEFWAGTSFQRTDDGHLLSYELARVVVEQMARDWEAFEAFAATAERQDAGAAAARQALGIDLGAYVGALLQADGSAGWAPHPACWGGQALAPPQDLKLGKPACMRPGPQ